MKQELLNLIDKVIGKKDIMRSPAWWVNRIFKKTLDYTEEYTDKVTKDAESRASAKIDALDASKEDKIMTVYVPSILEDTYQPWMTEENKRFYEEVKAGRCHICKIAANATKGGAAYMTGTPMWLINTVFVSALYHFGTSNNLPDVTFQLITIGIDGDASLSSLSCALLHNTSLKTINNQTLIGSGNIEIGAEVVDNLESESTTAALSANQGRVLNEKMLLIREIQPVVDGMEYTQEQQEYNVETYRIMSSGKAIAWYVMGDIVIPTGQGYHSSKGHYYSYSNVDFTKIDVSKKIASLECERIYLYSDGKAEQQILETVSISLK